MAVRGAAWRSGKRTYIWCGAALCSVVVRIPQSFSSSTCALLWAIGKCKLLEHQGKPSHNHHHFLIGWANTVLHPASYMYEERKTPCKDLCSSYSEPERRPGRQRVSTFSHDNRIRKMQLPNKASSSDRHWIQPPPGLAQNDPNSTRFEAVTYF